MFKSASHETVALHSGIQGAARCRKATQPTKLISVSYGSRPIPTWCSIESKDARFLSLRFAIPRSGRGVMSCERFWIATRRAAAR
jgi:hypothetical protein